MVGRWSDAYGRKVFMLLSLVCSAAQIVAMLLYILLDISLFWVFPAMVGGHEYSVLCNRVSCIVHSARYGAAQAAAVLRGTCKRHWVDDQVCHGVVGMHGTPGCSVPC